MKTLKINEDKQAFRVRKPLIKSNIRYGKIVITTDADTDGYSICAQLINFFYKYWPELVKHDKLYICNTPIMQAKSKKETLNFYTLQSYRDWWAVNEKDKAKWKISYKKGLAALDNESYKKMLFEPNLTLINDDIDAQKTLNEWFIKDKEHREIRKQKIK